MNTREGKRLRRIERRLKSDKKFNEQLHAAYCKKYPIGKFFETDDPTRPAWVKTPKKPPISRLIVSRACVKVQAYLRKIGLPHSHHIASLAA